MTHQTATPPGSTPTPPAPAVENFAPVSIETVQRPDGACLVRSTVPLAPHEPSIVHAFRAGARAHPDRVLIAERSPDGDQHAEIGRAHV